MKRLNIRTLQKLSTNDAAAVLDARERDAEDLIRAGIDSRARAAGRRMHKRVAQLWNELGFSEAR